MKKLTPALLRKIVLSEKRKIKETLEKGEEDVEKVKADEVDAGKYADSIEKDINYIKALDIQERRLMKKIKALREAKKIIKKHIRKL